jgi:hypothetical protein
MSSDVYQPTTDAAPEPAPTEVVQLVNEQQFHDAARDGGMLPPEGPFAERGRVTPDQLVDEGYSQEAWARAATEETRKRRSGPSEFDQPPLREIRSAREVFTGGDAVRQATRDYTFTNRFNEAERLVSEGVDPNLAQAAVMAGEPPPTLIVPVDDKGNELEPIGRRLEPENKTFNTVHEATEYLKNQRAKAEQDEWLRLRQQQESEAAERDWQQQAAAQAELQQAQPQPQQAPQAQPDDPLAAERQALAVQYQIAQLSAEERRSYDALAKIGRWANQNAAAIAQVARDPARNPKAYAQIKSVDDAAKAWKRHLDAYEQSRVLRQNALVQHYQADAERRYKDYSSREDELFSQHAPEMASAAQARDLRNDVTQMFRDVGFNDDEVDHAWTGKGGVALRDHRVQRIIRDAALWRRANARAQEVRRRPLPPPQRPGTIPINRGAEADDARIASINKQLETASGRRALDLSTQLTRLQRAAGRL